MWGPRHFGPVLDNIAPKLNSNKGIIYRKKCYKISLYHINGDLMVAYLTNDRFRL